MTMRIKGPRLGLEGRYAPVEGTSGSLALDLFYDLDQHDPGGAGPGLERFEEPVAKEQLRHQGIAVPPRQ